MQCSHIGKCLLLEALWSNKLTCIFLPVRRPSTRLLGRDAQERGVARNPDYMVSFLDVKSGCMLAFERRGACFRGGTADIIRLIWRVLSLKYLFIFIETRHRSICLSTPISGIM